MRKKRDESASFVNYSNSRSSSNITKQKSNQPKAKQVKLNITCYSCHNKKHFAKECRFRKPRKNKDKKNVPNSPNDSIGYNAFCAEMTETEGYKIIRFLIVEHQLI